MLGFTVATIFNRLNAFLLTLLSLAFPFWKTGPTPSLPLDPVSDCPASCTQILINTAGPREWAIDFSHIVTKNLLYFLKLEALWGSLDQVSQPLGCYVPTCQPEKKELFKSRRVKNSIYAVCGKPASAVCLCCTFSTPTQSRCSLTLPPTTNFLLLFNQGNVIFLLILGGSIKQKPCTVCAVLHGSAWSSFSD